VGFHDEGNGASAVTLFSNTGTITGPGTGVYFRNGVTTLNNSGSIVATAADGAAGIFSDGNVGTATNSGLIKGAGGFATNSGGNLTSLTNTASGQIIGTKYSAVYVDGGMPATVSNAGLISGKENAVALTGGGTVTNTGTLIGTDYAAIWTNGKLSVVNSGTIQGGSIGNAIDFSGADDMLTITTGSQIFGAVDFDGGNDTLDFAGFQGNTVLDVPGLDAVVAGARAYVWDQPNDKLAIIDLDGMSNQAIGQGLMGAVQSLNGLAWDQIGAPLPVPTASIASNYTAVAPKAAALGAADTAVMSDLDVGTTGPKLWGGVFGGGSSDSAPVDRSNLYGGIVAGSHAQLSGMVQLGGLGGVVQSSASELNGTETLASTTGVVGLYGSAQMGVANVDFALLGGYSAHTSNRKVVANNTVEIAKGLFSSVFIAPSVALSIPVLSNEAGDVSLTGGISYVGGLTSGYTETGSSMNLVVGKQSIGVLDARVGAGFSRSLDAERPATFTAEAGLFGQSNFGSASVPVTTFGQTINVATPGSSAFGVYGGAGIKAQLSDVLSLSVRGDASIRTDGVVSGSARASLGGSF
jgi:hypothetical protein